MDTGWVVAVPLREPARGSSFPGCSSRTDFVQVAPGGNESDIGLHCGSEVWRLPVPACPVVDVGTGGFSGGRHCGLPRLVQQLACQQVGPGNRTFRTRGACGEGARLGSYPQHLLRSPWSNRGRGSRQAYSLWYHARVIFRCPVDLAGRTQVRPAEPMPKKIEWGSTLESRSLRVLCVGWDVIECARFCMFLPEV
jgi:hypothetical protein